MKTSCVTYLQSFQKVLPKTINLIDKLFVLSKPMLILNQMVKETKKLNNIKEVLLSKGIKASFIAKQLGCNPNTVYNWTHQRSQPSLDALNQLASIINCKVSDLIYDSTSKN
jgi:putative transcriptional regulator